MNRDKQRAAALAYAEAVREHQQPCKYGHLDCAATYGGACMDEVFSIAGLDNNGDPLPEDLDAAMQGFHNRHED
jgi:hypothetical protein